MAIKQDIEEYLEKERDCILREQEENQQLPEDEKVEKGLLVRNAVLNDFDPDRKQAFFTCTENNSKFRTGDRIDIVSNGKRFDALVVENGLEEITVQVGDDFIRRRPGAVLSLEAKGVCLVDNILALLAEIVPGASGYPFLIQLSTSEEERQKRPVPIPAELNGLGGVTPYEASLRAAEANPCFYCIQGPPGSGKTALLSDIASRLNEHGKSVLIIANTHQAVNNALSAIHGRNPNSFTAKIGSWLKRDKLVPGIRHFKNLWTCASAMRAEHRDAPAVGMTFLSAVLEVGLKKSGFIPDAVLVDEASQISLPYASILGRFRAPSIFFFGDERQMPPIFRAELQDSPLSKSIFEHLKSIYPALSVTLDKTYRMNDEICYVIQKSFYPDISLRPDDSVRDKRFSSELSRSSQHPNSAVQNIFNDDKSVQLLISGDENALDSNEQEAELAKEIVCETLKLLQDRPEISKKDRIAVITPFRRQARLIRGKLRAAGIDAKNMPLVDTVERLQGQQVDVIVLSFCSSDYEYIRNNFSFLFDPRRTNVMISRAKTKVVIIASERLIGMDSHNPVGALLQRIRSGE